LRIIEHRALKAVAVVVAASALAGFVAVGERVRQLNSNITVLKGIDQLIGSDDRPTERATTSAEPDPLDPFGGRAVNILITAIDSREGENRDAVGDSMDTLSNDVNMIAHISADRERVDVMAIPRDTMVAMPACTRADGSQTDASNREQINTAFALGSSSNAQNKSEGAACVFKTIESVTTIPLDSVILVDFAGFASVVDALGGVDVCTPEGLTSKKAHLSLEPGSHHLDGLTALQYARTRDPRTFDGRSLSDGSDIQRISHQQQLIATVINEVLASGNLKSINKLNTTASAITKSLYVGSELGSVVGMAGLAYSLRDIKLENISLFTVPWAPDSIDANRVKLASWGTDSRFGGLNAAEIFELIATDQQIPGTVPYKLANPEAPSGAASAEPDQTASQAPDNSPPDGPNAVAVTPEADDDFVTPRTVPTAECKVEGQGSNG
jgi:LCP family protein required for cell wall assembly